MKVLFHRYTYRNIFSGIPAILLLLVFLLTNCETPADEVLALEAESHAAGAHVQERGAPDLPQQELAKLRAAVARYHNIEKAFADGYDFDLTGYRRQMGHHFLKISLLDAEFELEKPEVLMYVKQANGRWRFVGVEYAVPIENMQNIPPPPAGFSGDSDVWEVNHEFEVWTLHVWVGLHNPHGIFAPHNPRLP